MGFRIPIDTNAVTHQIHIAGVEMRSNRTDGFNQWEIKQQLYKIQWLLEEVMESSPTFADEAEFLKNHEQEKIVRILGK